VRRSEALWHHCHGERNSTGRSLHHLHRQNGVTKCELSRNASCIKLFANATCQDRRQGGMRSARCLTAREATIARLDRACLMRPLSFVPRPRSPLRSLNAKLVRRWKKCFKVRYRVIRLASGYARSTERAAGAWAVGGTRTRLPAGPRWTKTSNLIAGASFLGASHPFQSRRIYCRGWSITSRSGSARRLSRSEVPGSPVFPAQ
jgi:hypothetical protein